MKALLVQLYFIPEFRYAMIDWFDSGDPKAETGLVRQVRDFFLYMQQQEHYDGPPVLTDENTDANEYLELLLDELENKLQGTRHENLLKTCFQGQLVSQVICREEVSVNGRVYPVDDPFKREREEKFNVLSLTIKNKKTVRDALAGFVESDILEGDNQYLCYEAEREVDAEKRQCLKTLPRTLFLHLKRYELDFTTFTNVKINDRLEFPHKLNVEPFTAAGLDRRKHLASAATREGRDAVAAIAELDLPSECDYDLVGVLVHRGSTTRGVYSSYIMDRGADGGLSGSWQEYLGGTSKAFDVDRLEEACFGGEEKNFGAYILVYTKTNAPSLSEDEDAAEEREELQERMANLSVSTEAQAPDLAQAMGNLRV